MRWTHGYLLLCLTVAAILARDLLPILPHLQLSLPPLHIYAALLSYIASVALVGAFLPGKIQLGMPLSDGTRLKYKCNGLLVTGAVVTILAFSVWNGYIRASWVAHNYAHLFVATNLYALVLSTYLFVKGRLSRPPNWLKPRSMLSDFVMGSELNPFLFGVNLKFFSYRPSMCGWLIVNLSFLAKQYETHGFISGRMMLYQITTAWYIWDYFVHETKIVSTWDIIAEHFGLMLVWGDYVFIVFAFSVQNLLLLHDTRHLSYWKVIVILLTFSAGFAIFRGANSQKHQFKTNPNALIWGKAPITVGGKLLAAGFWGMARHMNYTGDLLLALSFCLPCGRTSSLGYLYFVYLLLLTVHREKRDDERCSQKYKSLWDDYCRLVPYRMVPFVY
ncbi:unnamed protein product [Agarophyton chilense]|eukprot:gb/GEZJ01002520.1/.p2 GENE.gb/GEZJ01002520.1/~~gb/GEZJ01002520.1/.p2  ORF type:complete len:389 (-),score=27.79 gb/GEZJ01002520.1/:307-1473(-)